MVRIPSPNDMPPFTPGGGELPSGDPGYKHPADTRSGWIPMAFQITSPLRRQAVLMPHALVLHVNPLSLQESHNQKVERFQTRGGWQEQHWGSDLMEISADATTGAFMNIYTGLTSVLRQRTIAWDRYRDLVELFKNNGSLHDPYGNIVLQGAVMLIYDRGTYIGSFRSFETQEAEETPFSFKLNWSFKVEQTLMRIPVSLRDPRARVPAFQGQNVMQGTREQVRPLEIEQPPRLTEDEQRAAEWKRLDDLSRARAVAEREAQIEANEQDRAAAEAKQARAATNGLMEGIREHVEGDPATNVELEARIDERIASQRSERYNTVGRPLTAEETNRF